jgi:hypothetical protein
MSTPWAALYATGRSSSGSSSSPLTGVYQTALSNFVAMKTQIVRKPYSNMGGRTNRIVEAQILSPQLYAIDHQGPSPHIEIHDTGSFIMIQMTGSSAWIADATKRIQAAGWKKNRNIQIKETVELKPHLTRANYMGPPHPANIGAMHNYVGSTPSPDDRPVMIGTHGPASVRKSWMNMDVPASREGAVSYSARHYGIPVPNMARSSGKHRASRIGRTGFSIPYTEQLAYEKGAHDALAAAVENMATSVSNAAGGRRKTRKTRL